MGKPDPTLPLLTGISRIPFLHDGELVSLRGYHAESGVYLDDYPELPAVTAEEGLADWRELLVDYPLVDESDFQSCMAYALDFVARHSYAKHPACVVTKPATRTGATGLVSVLNLAAHGREPMPLHLETGAMGDTENEKKLVGLLGGNFMSVTIDNIEGPLKSPKFTSMLTMEEWGGRVLGTNKTRTFPTRSLSFILTGNAVQMGEDLVRRMVAIRLDALTTAPGG